LYLLCNKKWIRMFVLISTTFISRCRHAAIEHFCFDHFQETLEWILLNFQFESEFFFFFFSGNVKNISPQVHWCDTLFFYVNGGFCCEFN